MTKYLNNFSDFELKSNSNEWICILSTPAITFIPYSKVIFYIDKNNFQINKQQMFYITAINFESRGLSFRDFPVIEINYSNFRVSRIELEKITITRYVLQRGETVTPTSLYKGYTVIN